MKWVNPQHNFKSLCRVPVRPAVLQCGEKNGQHGIKRRAGAEREHSVKGCIIADNKGYGWFEDKTH